MRRIVASVRLVGTHHDILQNTSHKKSYLQSLRSNLKLCWCAYLASFLISRQKKTGVRGICESRDLCFEDAESSSWKLRAEAANSPEVHVVVVMMDHSWAWLIMIDWLVVSNISYFPFHIWDVILPIDELIFFKMLKPPTSWFYRVNFWFVSPRALPEWWQPFGTGMEPTWFWSALLAALRLVDGCHIDVMLSWKNMSWLFGLRMGQNYINAFHEPWNCMPSANEIHLTNWFWGTYIGAPRSYKLVSKHHYSTYISKTIITIFKFTININHS